MDKYKNLPIYEKYVESLKTNKKSIIYECITCKYYTLNKNNYKRHCLNAKHLNGGQQLARKKKEENDYNCINCNYKTENIHLYNRHKKSKRHILMESMDLSIKTK